MSSSSYGSYHLKGNFYTKGGWYFFYMPFGVPYQGLLDEAESQGLFKGKKNRPILEKGASFGKGWIAVEIDTTTVSDRERIKKFDDEFISFEHIGPYKKMGESYQKIMKKYPDSKEFYNLYLNSPNDVAENELKTLILFKEK